jgi:hypothetical protein
MKIRVAANPWMINVAYSLAEKWRSDKLNSYELEFGKCLNDLEVMDLNFSGCFYTWTNKSEEPRFVARKNDRVLANEYWMRAFGRTIVDFKSGGMSDHFPAVISVGFLQNFGPKHYWREHKDFLD